jgi:phosphate transport system substrate-binding protein
VTLAYEGVGSSAGVARIKQRAVDFGASDVAPSDAELAQEGLVALPTVVTGVVPVINVQQIGSQQLRLTGDVLARIFLGEIANWNAPEIRALNPSLALPAAPIRVVVRADGSGTTYNFTDYLAKVSTAWKGQRGVKSSFEWPASFIAAKGSDGVVKAVKETTGAIGYVDFNYVLDHALTGVAMKNAQGEFVGASPASFREAVVNSAWYAKGDFGTTLTNMNGRATWPIAMGTFVIIPRTTINPEGTLRALRFVAWGYLHGDELAKVAKSVPLPDTVQAKAYKAMAGIRDDKGTQIGWQVLGTKG